MQAPQADPHTEQTLSTEQWTEQLSSLLELLKAGNLRAVDISSELSAYQHPHPAFAELQSHIQKLNFSAAITAAQTLLEEH
ncbi:hypothetical protein LL240_07165 [Oceanimonas baumannii]|uniref:hypothetical protein n=1 Tax=Oceanimonas baumannii TaxID=129578 RepID=UPI001D19655D|nr:hypothetical protein [Oceanimonas baumannii]MCC4264233.1 hypothetical protein [Oceanimonas baumannii]